MTGTRLRRAIARTPLAPVAAFPTRVVSVARHDARVMRDSARWLFTSREHHNYTYDLTALSREHLAWFVSVVCDVPVKQIRAFFAELESEINADQETLRDLMRCLGVEESKVAGQFLDRAIGNAGIVCHPSQNYFVAARFPEQRRTVGREHRLLPRFA